MKAMDNKRYILKTIGNVLQVLDTKNFNRVIEIFDARFEKDDATERLNSLNARHEINLDKSKVLV